MRLIGRYLKKHMGVVLAVVLMLFAEAICELYLPNMMSDVVNTGIQQGGIEQGAPKVISSDGKNLIELLGGGETFGDAYEKATQENTPKQFASAADQDAYVLKESSDSADEAYNNAIYALYLMAQEMGKETGVSSEMDAADMDMSAFYAGLSSMAASGAADRFLEQADDADELTKAQVATSFTELFYRELGVDIDALRMDYIINSGLEMLGVALLGAIAAVLVSLLAAKVSMSLGQTAAQRYI